MKDYAGAWTAERGRCFRLLYGTDDGHPERCPEPPVRSGWRQDGEGRRYALDACVRHIPQLLERPRPGAPGGERLYSSAPSKLGVPVVLTQETTLS
jgi:hypothetical protein